MVELKSIRVSTNELQTKIGELQMLDVIKR